MESAEYIAHLHALDVARGQAEDLLEALWFTEIYPRTENPLVQLAMAAKIRSETDDRIAQLVRSSRRRGASWVTIGASLGVTGQAVQQRFGSLG